MATPSVSNGRLQRTANWRARYELVREELAETIRVNEMLGAPSARAMEKLFTAIDAEEASAARTPLQRSSGTPKLATTA